MEFLQRLATVDFNYMVANFRPGGPYGIPSLACTLIVVWAYFVYRRSATGRPAGLSHFVHWLFPKRIFFHRSTAMDLRLWLLNATVLGFMYFFVAISSKWIRDTTIGGLTLAFGEHAPTAWPVWLSMALTSILILLAYELAYWFGHFVFHKYAFLWEFHKVHHSAEVMTTLTELRQHPIEILAFVNLIAISTGATLGVLTYVFGPGAHSFTLFDANLLLLGFLMTWGHLRHSHIWWSFTGVAGRLFQSPAHHQLHHSDHPDHWDKNLGFALAVWDWLFGTLVIPPTDRKVLNVRFGVGETHGDYDTVTRVFVRPFIRSAEQLLPAHPQPGAAAPTARN